MNISSSSSDGSEGQPSTKCPRAFSCIKFSTASSVQPIMRSGAGEAEAGEESESVQELLAVSASMQLYHFTNVPIAAIKVGRWGAGAGGDLRISFFAAAVLVFVCIQQERPRNKKQHSLYTQCHDDCIPNTI